MCNDKAINYLSNIGFNAVGLPMEGIKPLHLMRQLSSGQLQSLGDITLLITPCTTGTTPKIKSNCQVKTPKLDDLVTDSFDFSFGTDIANNILKQLGIQQNVFKQLGFNWSEVRKIKFSFENILCDATTVEAVDNYVRIADAGEVKDIISDMIIDYTMDRPKFDPGDYQASLINHPPYFIVLKTLKSNNFSISAYDDKDMGINLGIPISNVISLGLNCSVSVKSENLLSFKGDKHLTFGVQLAPIRVEKRGMEDRYSLITKFDVPPNLYTFTGEIFTPKEYLQGDPFLTQSNTVVKLDHGNPIRVKTS
jgi:hypothetical protein